MSDGFREALEGGEEGMVADLSPERPALLVAFGGIANQIAMPPFEFFRLSSALDAKKVFLRDLDQAWYHRGVRGFSTDVGSTSAALESLVDEVGAQRVVFTGNSAGGYAALLFGALSRSPVVVHAFSPQTLLGRWRRLVVHDRRWKEEIGRLRASDAGSEWMDLRGVLKASSGRSVLHVHYPVAHRLDRLHAWRLRGLPGVELHPEEGGGHNVIRTLRDRGELGPLIAGALAPDPPDPPA